MNEVSQSTVTVPSHLTVEQIAADLVVSPPTIRRLIGRGELSAVRVGRQLRVPADEFGAYLDRQREGRDRTCRVQLGRWRKRSTT